MVGMKIDHLHFYVDDAVQWQAWFVDCLGFQGLGAWQSQATDYRAVQSGSIVFLLSSPRTTASAVAYFFQHHPPGIVDVALEVEEIERTLAQALQAGATLLQPLQHQGQHQGQIHWAKIGGWGTVHHTLIQRDGLTPAFAPGIGPLPGDCYPWSHAPRTHALCRHRDRDPVSIPCLDSMAQSLSLSSRNPVRPWGVESIDHVVLNVEKGQLTAAIDWYQKVLGFQPHQIFDIQTDASALRSQVLVRDQIQFPINEPSSGNSQIQEFLDHNRGPGIQHVALHTWNAIRTINELCRRGIPFLEIPAQYYETLGQRLQLETLQLETLGIEMNQLAAQGILLDWHPGSPQAALLQTFTQPIFSQPTFFFEIIERRTYRNNQGQSQQAQGFGEGNFQALFEAIEREQEKRGNLQSSRS
jgi:4-hydroxyphenylpyruvate dioxygenase